MTITTNTCILLAAAVALAVPAAAQAEEREAVKLELSTQGVDFANPRSVAAFYSKARRQIADLCTTPERFDAGSRSDRQCRAEFAANLNRALNQMAVANVAGQPFKN